MKKSLFILLSFAIFGSSVFAWEKWTPEHTREVFRNDVMSGVWYENDKKNFVDIINLSAIQKTCSPNKGQIKYCQSLEAPGMDVICSMRMECNDHPQSGKALIKEFQILLWYLSKKNYTKAAYYIQQYPNLISILEPANLRFINVQDTQNNVILLSGGLQSPENHFAYLTANKKQFIFKLTTYEYYKIYDDLEQNGIVSDKSLTAYQTEFSDREQALGSAELWTPDFLRFVENLESIDSKSPNIDTQSSSTYKDFGYGYSVRWSLAYLWANQISWIDWSSFQLFPSDFIADKNGVYKLDVSNDQIIPIQGIDKRTLVILNGEFIKDASHVYQCTQMNRPSYSCLLVPGADASSFVCPESMVWWCQDGQGRTYKYL